jgi:hypothetical protein
LHLVLVLQINVHWMRFSNQRKPFYPR